VRWRKVGLTGPLGANSHRCVIAIHGGRCYAEPR
jgi:hypothetical protein